MISLNTNETTVYTVTDIVADLSSFCEPYRDEKIFVLTDKNSCRYCFGAIEKIEGVSEQRLIVIDDGDGAKSIETVQKVWQQFVDKGASRHSLVINLGGGMLCDLGGFAAATFKRGVSFVNIPTTLLAQVDASVGGKTGINFAGYKNEIGTFQQAKAVLIDTSFLKTLDSDNLCSGYAEMIKHALLKGEEMVEKTLSFDIFNPCLKQLSSLVGESVKIKDYYVTADPREQGIRKALNLGHTVGHAFESLSLKKGEPVLHGYAVAYGMAVELFLAHLKLGYPLKMAEELTKEIKRIYGVYKLNSIDYEYIYEAVLHDKKNRSGRINFTLLKLPGKIVTDVNCSREEIVEALDLYQKNSV
ncbi:3-dehydroquinate synthase [Marinilabiliaceae bacterium ANBcel2]|nr:3-dehydroquinate synthase [Marinilabiliaceae bacterium ANBcel2]